MSRGARYGLLVALLLPLLGGGCGGAGEARLPEPHAAAARLAPEAAGELRGNVLEVRIPLDATIVRRGGTIWARGGPYFYLFSLATRDILVEHPDLAAVRVVTVTGDGTEIARAMLRRDAFTENRWREAMARSALAQRDGTTRPRAIEEMVAWGEDYVEYEYNPEFVGR